MNRIKVSILTNQDCSYCDQAKLLFDKLSTEYTLDVEVLDLMTPEGEEAARKSGAVFPSSILLNDRLFCYGRPSEAIIRKELSKRVNSSK